MDNNINRILAKRFQTTMIGSLFEFEKTFGYLWGHNKDETRNLTQAEESFRDAWEFTRDNILNNGNKQLRQALLDIESLSGNVQYSYQFYVPKQEKTNEN